jgi:hypothetical protein
MNLQDLTARLEAARIVEVSVQGATFNVRLPTDYQLRSTMEHHRGADGRLLSAAAWRAVLEGAVRGWTGIDTRMAFGVEPAEAVAFSPDSLALLLEHRQDIADGLAEEMSKALADRRTAREAARKNL